MKLNKGFTSTLFSLLAIAIMISPALAVSEIDKNTEAQILALEGLYTSGDSIEIAGAVDKAEVLAMGGESEIGSEANNDSALINLNSGANLNTAYFDNAVSYVGNGSYVVAMNYTANPEETYTNGQWISIPLNITPAQILNYDFIRLNHDSEQNYYIVIQDDINNVVYKWSDYATEDTTSLFVPYLNIKSNLQNSLDSGVYLWIGGNQGNTALDGQPASIEFKLEAFELEPEDSLAIEDTTLYFLSIGIADIVLIVAFAFTTDYLDIKIDKKRR